MPLFDTTLIASLTVGAGMAVGILFPVLLSYVQKRHPNHSFDEYAAAPSSFGAPGIAFSMLGTIVGGGMFVGVTALGHRFGLVASFIGVASLAGLILMGSLAASIRTKLREAGAHGIVQLIHIRLGPWTAGFFCVVQTALLLMVLAAQFVAIRDVIVALKLPAMSHLVLAGAYVVTAIASWWLSQGLRRDILSDIFQLGVIAVGAAIIVAGTMSATGLDVIRSQGEAALIGSEGGTKGLFLVLGALVLMPATFLGRLDVWQRIVAAKSDRAASVGFFVAGFGAVLAYLFFVFLGVAGKGLGCQDSDIVAFCMGSNAGLPSYYAAVVLAAFFAAVVGTADTYVNNAGVFIAMARASFFGDKKQANPSTRTAKIGSLAVLAAAAVLAWSSGDVVELFAAAFGVVLIFVPTVVEACWASRPSPQACLWGFVAGFTAHVSFMFAYGPTVSFILAAVCCGIVHFLVRKKGWIGRAS